MTDADDTQPVLPVADGWSRFVAAIERLSDPVEALVVETREERERAKEDRTWRKRFIRLVAAVGVGVLVFLVAIGFVLLRQNKALNDSAENQDCIAALELIPEDQQQLLTIEDVQRLCPNTRIFRPEEQAADVVAPTQVPPVPVDVAAPSTTGPDAPAVSAVAPRRTSPTTGTPARSAIPVDPPPTLPPTPTPPTTEPPSTVPPAPPPTSPLRPALDAVCSAVPLTVPGVCP